MAARLHHEWIAHSDATPDHALALTHGIFGAGSNWRGIARKLVDRRRDWAVVLVDLRQHGRSDAGAPPHTIAACADDVRALVAELAASGRRVTALGGHSFGGKVMLAARSLIEVEQTWMLDASPAPRPGAFDDPDNGVVRVLSMLQRISRTWASRDAFIAAVIAEGHEPGLAQWLAMNLVADGSATFVQRLDTHALRELLADYYATDLWSAVHEASRGRIEVAIATRAEVLTADDRERLARAGNHVRVHDIDAGHWLHIEAPAAVVELLASGLP